MKKILLIATLLAILVGCNTPVVEKSDAIKFKETYEALNGTTNDSGKEHMTITIPENNPMVFASGEQVIEMLTSGTGIIYFGYPECPWCRSALPVFLEATYKELVTEVLYYNNLDQRNIVELDDAGEVVVTQEGTEEYAKILDLLGDFASEYEGLNDPTIKRIYFPTMVFVKDGQVVGTHVGSVDSVEDSRVPMTDEQHQELYDIYIGLLALIKDVCDSAC